MTTDEALAELSTQGRSELLGPWFPSRALLNVRARELKDRGLVQFVEYLPCGNGVVCTLTPFGVEAREAALELQKATHAVVEAQMHKLAEAVHEGRLVIDRTRVLEASEKEHGDDVLEMEIAFSEVAPESRIQLTIDVGKE